MVCPFCAELGDPYLCDLHEMEIAARHTTKLREEIARLTARVEALQEDLETSSVTRLRALNSAGAELAAQRERVRGLREALVAIERLPGAGECGAQLIATRARAHLDADNPNV